MKTPSHSSNQSGPTIPREALTLDNFDRLWREQYLERRLAADRRSSRDETTVRFSPAAWAKLIYIRDLGDTEVGGFGISRKDDLLYIEDFVMVKQECTEITVAFDDVAVADFFEDQVEMKRKPEQFGRIWMHTHPGSSAQPSGVDWDTFERVFGRCDWALMFILAKGGNTYARLRYNTGPGVDVDLPVKIDFTAYEFDASDRSLWRREYLDNVFDQRLARNFWEHRQASARKSGQTSRTADVADAATAAGISQETGQVIIPEVVDEQHVSTRRRKHRAERRPEPEPFFGADGVDEQDEQDDGSTWLAEERLDAIDTELHELDRRIEQLDQERTDLLEAAGTSIVAASHDESDEFDEFDVFDELDELDIADPPSNRS